MGNFRHSPIAVYDEPVTYNQFNGGINTDPSNENLVANELRDAVNFHYSSSVLSRRKGATVQHSFLYNESEMVGVDNLKDLTLDVNAHTVHQKYFTLEHKTGSYAIIARNGWLFYGIKGSDETVVLDVLRVNMDKYYDTESEYYGADNPLNQSIGLSVSTTINKDKHTGYVYKETKTVFDEELETDVEKDFYGLVFQNTRRIQEVVYKNKIYLATGTRIVVVEVVDGDLQAHLLDPRYLTAYEVSLLGFNYMSPYPERLLKDAFETPMTKIGNLVRTAWNSGTNTATFRLYMAYALGKTASDYRFKWETSIDNGATWTVVYPYSNASSKAKVSHDLVIDSTKKYKIKCSFARSFKSTYDLTTDQYYYNTLEGDWVVDKADGDWFGSIIMDYDPATYGSIGVNQKWLDIQSCVKVLGDGNKFIFYDDINNTGNWYKTVIDKPDYITDRGSLCFQSTKNETLIGAVMFKGVIITFANGAKGGNIAIVNGNGDDVEIQGTDFSPYTKRIVNTNVSCDNFNSIQVTDNFLIFKYGSVIYALDSSELSKDIISLMSVNDRITPRNRYNLIDWSRQDYVSEVTEDYYAIIWPALEDPDTGNIIKEAHRWKMYYRYMQSIDNSNKPHFPWLKDISPALDIYEAFYDGNNSCHITEDDKIVHYNSDVYFDYNHIYLSSVKIKGVDLAYPKLIKFLQNLSLYYYRDQEDIMKMRIVARNEAGHILYEDRKEAFMDYESDSIQFENKDIFYDRVRSREDYRVLIADKTPLIERVRLDSTMLDTKVYTPEYKFPFLLVELEIEISSPQAFSLASVTYNYTATDTPDTTVFDLYTDIIKKGELT